MISVRGILLDMDGTLVDSNDAHARAWADAFAKHGYHVSFDKVRSCIGTGGDKLIQAVVRLPKDDPQAQELSNADCCQFRAKTRCRSAAKYCGYHPNH